MRVLIWSRTGCARASRGNPARFFVTSMALDGIDPIARIAVTKRRFPAYNGGTDTSSDGTPCPALQSAPSHAAATAKVIQPAWVRIMHWINAVAIILMIMSGWQIYNASPLFDFSFPAAITLGGWLGGALLWHFAAMWLLMVNGLRLSRARFCHRPLPQEAAADHAVGRDRRYQGGADLQAVA